MIDFEKLAQYKQYLNSIQSLLDSYFEHQSDYICCKKGCAHCCEKGVYPYSELEFNYLMLGVLNLPDNKKIEIAKRVDDLKNKYKNFKGNEFTHRCPFLDEDKTCTVYYKSMIQAKS